VKKGLNQQKMARYIDFRAPAGRESLWTIVKKKSNFHMAFLFDPKLPNRSAVEFVLRWILLMKTCIYDFRNSQYAVLLTKLNFSYIRIW
jgi:hypothetical protein